MERNPCKKTVLPFFCHVMREFLSSFFFPLRISSPLPQIPLKLQPPKNISLAAGYSDSAPPIPRRCSPRRDISSECGLHRRATLRRKAPALYPEQTLRRRFFNRPVRFQRPVNFVCANLFTRKTVRGALYSATATFLPNAALFPQAGKFVLFHTIYQTDPLIRSR